MASLRKLVESAFVGYLDTLGLSATVYSGVDADTKDAPAVIVKLAQATENPQFSGDYKCTVEVSCKSIAADGDTDHDALCVAVRDALWDSDLPAYLQQEQTGLRVFGLAAPHQLNFDVDGDCWVETQTVELWCAAHEFAA